MASVISIIFGRWDRDPSMHEYGEEVDGLVDTLVGGTGQLDRAGGPPMARIPGNPGRVELHETGPVVEIEADSLAEAGAVLESVRGLARAWAARQTTSGADLWVDVRVGPAGLEPWQRGTRRFTTDPLTLAAELPELIEITIGRHGKKKE